MRSPKTPARSQQAIIGTIPAITLVHPTVLLYDIRRYWHNSALTDPRKARKGPPTGRPQDEYPGMFSLLEFRPAHFLWLLAISLAGASSSLNAQEEGKTKPAADKAAAEAPQPVFFLRDGSRITGLPDFDSLQVKTRYGTLNVPSLQC